METYRATPLCMMNDISIILVENDDNLLEVVPLKQADDSECTGIPISEELALEKVLRIKDNGSDFWIARQGERTIGYAIGIVDGESYRSEGVYTSPDFRNQGVGASLEKAQVGFARELGCREIWSNVADVNKASKRVQEKLGFQFEPSGSGYIVRLLLRE